MSITKKIEGYENMTIEEKLAALEAYEPDMSGYIAKSVFDKKASEAAELNRQLKARMSEEEAIKAKEAEERAALLARVEELEREKKISTNVNSYLAIGYDDKLARETALALVEGDMETVFKNQKIHIENEKKALKTELLKQTPEPQGTNTVDNSMTLDAFRKLSPQERLAFSQANPEKYKEMYGGQK